MVELRNEGKTSGTTGDLCGCRRIFPASVSFSRMLHDSPSQKLAVVDHILKMDLSNQM